MRKINITTKKTETVIELTYESMFWAAFTVFMFSCAGSYLAAIYLLN